MLQTYIELVVLSSVINTIVDIPKSSSENVSVSSHHCLITGKVDLKWKWFEGFSMKMGIKEARRLNRPQSSLKLKILQ